MHPWKMLWLMAQPNMVRTFNALRVATVSAGFADTQAVSQDVEMRSDEYTMVDA